MTLCLMTDPKDAPPKIGERYSNAIGEGMQRNVIGAYAFADRRLTKGWRPTGPDGQGEPVKPAPLAVALERFFAGDGAAARVIVEVLAEKVFAYSWIVKTKITRTQAQDMAKAVLAWHRNGRCDHCGGHGYELIPGAPTLSERECKPCEGTGKIPLEPQFAEDHRELAKWLVVELTRDAGRAASEAMKALNDRMAL